MKHETKQVNKKGNRNTLFYLRKELIYNGTHVNNTAQTGKALVERRSPTYEPIILQVTQHHK
jgi:hypothetical protein